MKYQQITESERYLISYMTMEGISISQIATKTNRHRSTINRELKRNNGVDRFYKPLIAHQIAIGRRKSSRRNSYFGNSHWKRVSDKLYEGWSPEQISLKFSEQKVFDIHWETIYRYIRFDKENSGILFRELRQATKKRRKSYRGYDSRGKPRGKRHISTRPEGAALRTEQNHFEIDLVQGHHGKNCVMTLVDRKTRYTIIAKLRNKTNSEVNQKLTPLIKMYGIKTITADNGTEFHGYKEVEDLTGAVFYFATPHHSWERGTVENTNGLIRQYLPKWRSMRYIDQRYCNYIMKRLNQRPRKILGLKTPEECHYANAA